MNRFLIYIILSITTALSASEVNWAKDYHDGIKKAQELNKPVMFVSSNHNCRYCVILDEKTFKDERVAKKLNDSFVSIVSYSDEGDYLPDDLWRPGTPATWFLLPSGEPMYQPLMGAMDAENFLKALGIVEEEFNKEANKK